MWSLRTIFYAYKEWNKLSLQITESKTKDTLF
jgi:hypothetical protein